MAKPISIGIAADTRDAAQAIQKGVINPLEDVVDSLDDVERNSDSMADELERQFREAQKATERYEASVKDAAKTADRAADDAKDSTREVGREHEKLSSKIREEAQRARKYSNDEQDKTESKTKESLRELGEEAKQNAAETFSSFDGSVSSFADGLQGTLGGIVSSLGPGGAIAGALGAIGIGLLVNQLELTDEAKQEFRESVSELAGAWIDAGTTGSNAVQQWIDQIRDMALETDKGKANLDDMERAAEQLGMTTEEAVSAYLSGGPALDSLIAKTESLLASERTRNAGALAGAGYLDTAQQGNINNLEDELRLYQEQKQRIEDAARAVELYYATGVSEHEAKVAQIESINTAYDEAASAIDEFSQTEGGALDPTKYIEHMQAREEALRSYKDDLASADLSAEARKFLEEQGVDAASRFMQGYKIATPEQQAELNRIWSEAGRQNSGEYTTALESGLPDTIAGPTIEPQMPDLTNVRNRFQYFFDQNPVKVPLEANAATRGRDVG